MSLSSERRKAKQAQQEASMEEMRVCFCFVLLQLLSQRDNLLRVISINKWNIVLIKFNCIQSNSDAWLVSIVFDYGKQCAVSEKILTHPKEGHWKFLRGGEGGLKT